jgi:hypothetical protein
LEKALILYLADAAYYNGDINTLAGVKVGMVF